MDPNNGKSYPSYLETPAPWNERISPDYLAGISYSKPGSVPCLDAFPDTDDYLVRPDSSGKPVEYASGF